MSDGNDTRRQILEEYYELAAFGTSEDFDIESATITSTSIGTETTAIDTAYLSEDTLQWLVETVGESGSAYVDTVELSTEIGTFTMTVDDGSIQIDYTDD